MPTFNKKRYRTEKDIMNNPLPNDATEYEYRQILIKNQADRFQEQVTNHSGARFYTDLVVELAKRALLNTKEEIDTNAV